MNMGFSVIKANLVYNCLSTKKISHPHGAQINRLGFTDINTISNILEAISKLIFPTKTDDNDKIEKFINEEIPVS